MLAHGDLRRVLETRVEEKSKGGGRVNPAGDLLNSVPASVRAARGWGKG